MGFFLTNRRKFSSLLLIILQTLAYCFFVSRLSFSAHFLLREGFMFILRFFVWVFTTQLDCTNMENLVQSPWGCFRHCCNGVGVMNAGGYIF